MKNLIHSTTALTLSLSLALPAPVLAQGDVTDCDLERATQQLPCTFGDRMIGSLEEFTALRIEQGALTDPNQQDAATDENAAAAQAAAEEAARAEAERQAAEQAAADEAARAEAESQAAEQAAAEEAERQAAEQAAAEEAERQAAEQAAADEAARAEAERQAAEQAAAEEAERQAAEQAAQQAAEDEAARQAQIEEERRQARAEELAAAAAAAAAAEQGTAEAEVVTEEVQEGEVRRAGEEFATTVTGEESQNAATADADDDDGLSKFEKALLLGLGAVAVGSLLKNGDRVVSNSGDRLVVEDSNGDLRVLKDDDALIRRPGDEVRTETFNDGSSRTVVTKADGSRIVTIRGRDGTVLRRISIDPQGREYVLFDDLQQEEEIVINDLPQVQDTPTQRVSVTDESALRAALAAELSSAQAGRFSLRQVREIRQVRALAPELELDAVRFETGSAAIRPEQARSLTRIGQALRDLIAQDPRTVILVEGHTDAVGSETYNLALSDRRAETVALALTEYFDVPPENMITQGYGEAALKVPTLDAEPANRRAVVRNITSLLR